MVMLVAELPDGRIAGYADLLDYAEEHTRYGIDVRVPPAAVHAAEIADALLDAMEAHSRRDAVEGASSRLGLASTHELGRRVAEARGYEVYRHSFQMRIEFDAELAEPQWPEGISVRTFVRGQDDESVYEAQHDAFADHFEHVRWSYENWREWAFNQSFDPSVWWVAEDGDEIAGVCLGRSEGGAGGELGWINVLGVRPPWRRRGLGRAFLLHAFAEFRARGRRGVGLGVDGLNTTGAVRLYEQVGMQVARQVDQYKKSLRP